MTLLIVLEASVEEQGPADSVPGEALPSGLLSPIAQREQACK